MLQDLPSDEYDAQSTSMCWGLPGFMHRLPYDQVLLFSLTDKLSSFLK